MFNKEVSLPFNEGNELNLKRNQKSNRNKPTLSVNKIKDFFFKEKQKNHQDI